MLTQDCRNECGPHRREPRVKPQHWTKPMEKRARNRQNSLARSVAIEQAMLVMLATIMAGPVPSTGCSQWQQSLAARRASTRWEDAVRCTRPCADTAQGITVLFLAVRIRQQHMPPKLRPSKQVAADHDHRTLTYANIAHVQLRKQSCLCKRNVRHAQPLNSSAQGYGN